MKLVPTSIEGAFEVHVERLSDDRGFFARTFCADEFRANGLNAAVAQVSISFNPEPGTLRGLHLQRHPHGETKLIRCIRGRIFDVLLDVRPTSPTFLVWQGFDLDADTRTALYAPRGVAHGFLTLVANCEVEYQISTPYVPGAAWGFRWDDPTAAIEWPLTPSRVSERDRTWPDLVVPKLGDVVG